MWSFVVDVTFACWLELSKRGSCFFMWGEGGAGNLVVGIVADGGDKPKSTLGFRLTQ